MKTLELFNIITQIKNKTKHNTIYAENKKSMHLMIGQTLLYLNNREKNVKKDEEGWGCVGMGMKQSLKF